MAPSDTVKYLGCIPNKKQDGNKEVKARVRECMAVLKRMDIFWRHADCPIRFKVLVHEMVIRSKLMYGLESRQRNKSTVKYLDTFHLKGLRKILKEVTTFVDRSKNNKHIRDKAQKGCSDL